MVGRRLVSARSDEDGTVTCSDQITGLNRVHITRLWRAMSTLGHRHILCPKADMSKRAEAGNTATPPNARKECRGHPEQSLRVRTVSHNKRTSYSSKFEAEAWCPLEILVSGSFVKQFFRPLQ